MGQKKTVQQSSHCQQIAVEPSELVSRIDNPVKLCNKPGKSADVVNMKHQPVRQSHCRGKSPPCPAV